MKNLLTKLRYVPKQFAIATAIVVAGASAVLTYAWGPSRDTYTIANPAPKVTFNSITDNPNIGDERNFVGIRESGTTGLWQDTQPVTPGKEYVVRMYVHNNAAANLNLVAENVTAKFNLPTTTGTSIQVDGFLNSSNATPTEVYDHATFTSAQNFNLAVVPGSLKYYNNANGNGFAIPDSLFTATGAKLGYNQMDGKIPGCFQYAGYLTFIVKPQFAATANFTVQKQVRKTGNTGWNETVAVNPGDQVDYLITYDNISDVPQDNVVLKDTLPAGMSLVNGTTYVTNSTNPSGVKVGDGVATGDGINIGNYAGHSVAYVKFTAKVGANDTLPACGANTLKNVAKVTTDYGWKEDTADVTVTKTCVTPVPAAACKALTATQISRTEFSFAGTATTENGATVSKYTFVVKNSAGAVVKTVTVNSTALSANSGTITLDTVGVYTVALTVTTSLGDKTATSCQTTVEVKPAPVTPAPGVSIDKKVDGVDLKTVQLNTPFAYQIVVKNTGNVDLVDAVVSDTAPAGVTFVSAGTGTIANNAWTTTASLKVGESKSFTITAKVEKYVAGNIVNTACVNAKEVNPGEPTKADDCDEATVKVPTPEVPTIKVCDLKTRVVVTIKETDFDSSKHSKNLDDCKDTNVCRLSDKTVVTIKESEFDASKHSRNVEDCKATPVTIRVCELNTKQIVTIKESDFNASKHSRTTTDCNAPAVIANTGPEMLVGSLLGSSALGLGVSSYVRSRSALHRATRRS